MLKKLVCGFYITNIFIYFFHHGRMFELLFDECNENISYFVINDNEFWVHLQGNLIIFALINGNLCLPSSPIVFWQLFILINTSQLEALEITFFIGR
jgi:hypothetical protein